MKKKKRTGRKRTTKIKVRRIKRRSKRRSKRRRRS